MHSIDSNQYMIDRHVKIAMISINLQAKHFFIFEFIEIKFVQASLHSIVKYNQNNLF